jgi:hypothetical protein
MERTTNAAMNGNKWLTKTKVLNDSAIYMKECDLTKKELKNIHSGIGSGGVLYGLIKDRYVLKN